MVLGLEEEGYDSEYTYEEEEDDDGNQNICNYSLHSILYIQMKANLAAFSRDFCLSDMISIDDKILTHIYSILKNIVCFLEVPSARCEWEYKNEDISKQFNAILFVTSRKGVKHVLRYDFSNWCIKDSYVPSTTTTDASTSFSTSSVVTTSSSHALPYAASCDIDNGTHVSNQTTAISLLRITERPINIYPLQNNASYVLHMLSSSCPHENQLESMY